MKDRFDLENDIANTHNFSEHLRLISSAVLESEITLDELSNAINGVAQLLDLHTNKMFDTFTQAFGLDGYSED